MNVYSFAGAALLLAVSGFLLSAFGWRGAPLFGVLGVLLFLGRAVGALFPSLLDLFTSVPVASSFVTAAVKILGISYLGSLTSDICHDLGAFSAERMAIAAARAEIAILTLPFFSQILNAGLSLL